jgi:drebrin-like protein
LRALAVSRYGLARLPAILAGTWSTWEPRTNHYLRFPDGELAELIEDFNEGRIQFAFVKVRDPNTGLPKYVLIAWCGGGVPERTKGYFTSHLNAVANVLRGYHVQITARSDSDLSPENIVQKVADASGAKYTAGGSAPLPAAAPPPVAKKPVFTPTTSSTGSSFNPIVAARNRRQENVDDDGWGADAPPVSRTEIHKVESAYKPTKVDIAKLRQNRDESTGAFNGGTSSDRSGVIGGGYQPVGKVDIAALRQQAKKGDQDDRPTVVKGAYVPVGKVDIAEIRARAQPQRPSEPEETAEKKSLAERSTAFSQPERLVELPKPKVAKKFGATPFTGTKPPTPGGLGFGAPAAAAPPPVGAASRTFADQGGKTPAQLWAEKKAKQGGGSSTITPPMASPVTSQKSGSEWKSGYQGKSWGPVQTTNFGRGGVETQKTGGTDRSDPEAQAPASPAGGISALRDKFKDTTPISSAPSTRGLPTPASNEAPPPPLPTDNRPSGGFALPGLPSRPAADNQEEEEEEEPESSPVRIAMPVARSTVPDVEPPVERLAPRPVPVPAELPREEDLEPEQEVQDPRDLSSAVASLSLGQADRKPSQGGKRAVIQYDYEKAEENEIELKEGEYVTDIDMVDEDWWMGTNSAGEKGLFPSNYVELVDDDGHDSAPPQAPPAQTQAPEPVPATSQPAQQASNGPSATAQFDYEAAEDNGR